MPNHASFADTILEADQTLAACEANADLLTSIEKYRAPLEVAVTELKTMDFRRQTLIADKQKLSQDMEASVRHVKDLLLHLRAAIRGDIGPRSEKLVEFNVAPLRRRPRKPQPKPAEPPTR
ncbi:MAG TPA: hypothetical protein VEW48_22670 [Thermoanaerobaculia bacterium]|nr:hypothetical protein [Thermoanaerobaculia bacterium]